MQVFLACQTQWRKEIPAMADRMLWHGLDYPAVATVISLQGHRGKQARAVFEAVQTMEAAALPVLNKA